MAVPRSFSAFFGRFWAPQGELCLPAHLDPCRGEAGPSQTVPSEKEAGPWLGDAGCGFLAVAVGENPSKLWLSEHEQNDDLPRMSTMSWGFCLVFTHAHLSDATSVGISNSVWPRPADPPGANHKHVGVDCVLKYGDLPITSNNDPLPWEVHLSKSKPHAHAWATRGVV